MVRRNNRILDDAMRRAAKRFEGHVAEGAEDPVAEKAGSRVTEGNGRRRLQIEFSPEMYERLLRLGEVTDCSTKAEVVKKALRVYEWAVEQEKAGFTIKVEKPGGQSVAIKIF